MAKPTRARRQTRATSALPAGALLASTLLAGALLAHGARPAHAQTAPGQAGAAASEAIKQYSVPESPAFTYLDVSPAKVTRPTTPRDLVASLVNAIDEGGRVRQGIALEFQPSAAFRLKVDLDGYQRRGLAWIASNAQVSTATVRAGGDASATDLAYGVRLTLFDRADPMADRSFTDGIVQAFSRCPGPPPPVPTPASPPPPPAAPGDGALETRVRRLEQSNAELTAASRAVADSLATAKQVACNQAAIKRLQEQYAADHWNDYHVALSYAGGHRLSASGPDRARELGHRVWLVAGAPLTRYGQVLAYGRFSNAALGTTPRINSYSYSYGARGVVGRPTFNAFAELIGDARDEAPAGTDKRTRAWSGGLEFRVAEQLWIATGFGQNGEVKGSPTVAIANLRWGFSDKARFAPR